jgi:hypothetical protein
MRGSNTFGLHFVLRPTPKATHAIYVRIVVNGTRCELALKQTIDRKDWNEVIYYEGEGQKTDGLVCKGPHGSPTV